MTTDMNYQIQKVPSNEMACESSIAWMSDKNFEGQTIKIKNGIFSVKYSDKISEKMVAINLADRKKYRLYIDEIYEIKLWIKESDFSATSIFTLLVILYVFMMIMVMMLNDSIPQSNKNITINFLEFSTI